MTYSCHSGANLNYLPIAKIRIKIELTTTFNKKNEETMFGALKTGSLIYVLYKGDAPYLKMGELVANPVLRPKQNPQLMPNPLQFEQVLDLVVKVGDDTKNFTNVPPNASFCDAGSGYIISDDKNEITNEVEKFGAYSQNILNAIPFHKKVVSSVKQMMIDLNPSLQKEAQRDDEMSKMKSEMTELRNTVGELANLLKGALSPQQPSMGSSLIRKE